MLIVLGIILVVLAILAMCFCIHSIQQEDTSKSILLLFLTIVSLIAGLTFCTIEKTKGYKQQTIEMKIVQIDTIYTTTKEKTDTTYIVTYI